MEIFIRVSVRIGDLNYFSSLDFEITFQESLDQVKPISRFCKIFSRKCTPILGCRGTYVFALTKNNSVGIKQ